VGPGVAKEPNPRPSSTKGIGLGANQSLHALVYVGFALPPDKALPRLVMERDVAYEYLCAKEAAETGDEVGDVSRLFIYYVGRKADLNSRGNVNAKVKDEGMSISGTHSRLCRARTCDAVALESGCGCVATRACRRQSDRCSTCTPLVAVASFSHPTPPSPACVLRHSIVRGWRTHWVGAQAPSLP